MRFFGVVEIVRELDDLERTIWAFTVIETFAMLDGFRIERRQSRRHTFRGHSDERWSRIMNRDNGIKTPPKPPQNVIDEALTEFRSRLTYKESW